MPLCLQYAKKAKGNYVRNSGNCHIGQRYLNSIIVDEDAVQTNSFLKELKSSSSVTPREKKTGAHEEEQAHVHVDASKVRKLAQLTCDSVGELVHILSHLYTGGQP